MRIFTIVENDYEKNYYYNNLEKTTLIKYNLIQ